MNWSRRQNKGPFLGAGDCNGVGAIGSEVGDGGLNGGTTLEGCLRRRHLLSSITDYTEVQPIAQKGMGPVET